jgi:hypothetical protein
MSQHSNSLQRVGKSAISALIALAGVVAGQAIGAEPSKTICTVTINSADERDILQRHLPPEQYRMVELVQHQRPDWLSTACSSGVQCDALVISGHFDDGAEFYSDSFEPRGHLTVHDMQRASCSASCSGLFSQLKEVYLFGCNTLKSEPRFVASPEIQRSLLRAGRTAADADRTTALLSERYCESNRERLRHVFKHTPVLYGFASKAPLGRSAGPLLQRYFELAPPGEIASGRPSATMLGIFGPSSMIAVPGLQSSEPGTALRDDVCSLADDALSAMDKLAFVHKVLQREVAETRMFLDHLERYIDSIGATERDVPEIAAAFTAIERDNATRERYLEFARDADQASVQARMLAFARRIGWLTPAQHDDEFVRMVATRMSSGMLGEHEVDLICAARRPGDPPLASKLLSNTSKRPDNPAHAAAMACLGDPQAHRTAIRALTSSREADAAIARVYLRHRRLAGVSELRELATAIGRMAAGPVQVRALEALARQHWNDPHSLNEIARLFPLTRSLEVQRAIAGILIRSDYSVLGPASLAKMLREHRVGSSGGNDVVDVLIRLLQAS